MQIYFHMQNVRGIFRTEREQPPLSFITITLICHKCWYYYSVSCVCVYIGHNSIRCRRSKHTAPTTTKRGENHFATKSSMVRNLHARHLVSDLLFLAARGLFAFRLGFYFIFFRQVIQTDHPNNKNKPNTEYRISTLLSAALTVAARTLLPLCTRHIEHCTINSNREECAIGVSVNKSRPPGT